MFGEHVSDVSGIGWRRDGDNGLGFRHLFGGGEDRCAAEAVADQDRGRLSYLAQMVGGLYEIGDIRRERAIGEIALAGAEASEVEAQHGDALERQRRGDTPPRAHPCRK